MRAPRRKKKNAGIVVSAERSRRSVPSIVSVAERAGVSIATVSRVVNRDTKGVRKTTAQKVWRAIEELDYRPQRVGHALRTRQSRIVAVLVPDALNTLLAAVSSSIEMALREDERVMFLCNTMGDPRIQDEYLREARSHMVGGIVLAGAIRSPVLKRYVEEGEPMVFALRKSPFGVAAPFVGIDNYQAGCDIADHFLGMGYEPCGAIHGLLSSSASRELFYGFRDRMSEGGRPIADTQVRESRWAMESGYQAAVSLLNTEPRPRAVLCGNDLIAYGVHRRCEELGLSVPQDIALFGYDDNPLNEWLAPWLSTIRIPHSLFGPAVRQLLGQVLSEETNGAIPQIILPHEVVLRGSA